MAADAPTPPPKGIRPIWIQMKNFATYGLRREGAQSLADVRPFVLLKRVALLEEVQKLGFMSDFNDFRADLEALKAEDVVLVNDPAKRYGEQWYFAYDAAVGAALLDDLLASERAAVAGAAEREEAERLAREAEEAEAARLPVFENRPTIARPYLSASADETAREVAALAVRPERPLSAVVTCRPRRSFGSSCHFGDRDACDWLTDEQMARIGIRKYMEAAFAAYDPANPDRRLAHSAAQAAPTAAVAATQTAWHRPVNAACQYEPTRLGASEAKALASAGGLAAFLGGARPVVERALQQNETVDVFRCALAGSGNGEDENAGVMVAGKGEGELRELRTFTDLHHSKGRALAAIDGVPGRRGVVAVAAVRDAGFDERARASGHVERAHVLLWDFADLIHPVLRLESLQEVFCFRFNTTNPALVAAGCINGQVALWDASEAMAQADRRKKRQSTRHLCGSRSSGGPGAAACAGGEEEEDERKPLPALQPLAVSHIDLGHRRQVADFTWLPPHIQVNSRGQLLGPEHLDGRSHQFLTVAGDGQCLVWDVRFQAISEGLLPYLAKPRQADKKQRDEKAGAVAPKAPWLPLFRVQLNRTEGAGELTLCRVAIDLGGGGGGEAGSGSAGGPAAAAAAAAAATAAATAAPGDLRSRIMCTTEEGEIFSADWRAKAPAGGSGGGATADDADGDGDGDAAPDLVKWVARDHARPCVTLQKSPFYPDVLLSVGDWGFHLWKAEVQRPLFSSSASTAYLTVGRWSPTRPGTIFLGRADGAIDVWDLTDSSYGPSATLMASPARITSMEFLAAAAAPAEAAGATTTTGERNAASSSGAGAAGGAATAAAGSGLAGSSKSSGTGSGSGSSNRQQLLAVGDAAGNLHVFDVPHNLARPLSGEKAAVASFLHRELQRAHYVVSRLRQREAEAEALEAEAAAQAPLGSSAAGSSGVVAAAAAGGTGAASDGGALAGGVAGGHNEGPGEAAAAMEAAAAAAAEEAEMAAAEAAYRELEAQWEEELPQHRRRGSTIAAAAAAAAAGTGVAPPSLAGVGLGNGGRTSKIAIKA